VHKERNLIGSMIYTPALGDIFEISSCLFKSCLNHNYAITSLTTMPPSLPIMRPAHLCVLIHGYELTSTSLGGLLLTRRNVDSGEIQAISSTLPKHSENDLPKTTYDYLLRRATRGTLHTMVRRSYNGLNTC
jgi:hypothetical protein